MTTTTIPALMPNSRDQGARPFFIEKAARSQYSQNAAHATAKTSSTALIATQRATGHQPRDEELRASSEGTRVEISCIVAWLPSQ